MKILRRLILSIITMVLLSAVSVFAADSVINNSIGNKTLKAKWNLVNYTISYNLDGGSISGEKTSYTIETNTFTLPTPTKEGYDFVGWSGTGLTGNANTSVTVDKGSTGDRSYTANWEVSSALKFSSDDNFTLSATKKWNGVIEYSIDNGSTWTTWDGSKLSGTANQPIYVRGIGNSVISNGSRWMFTGKYCTGNIENLLDYQTVVNGEHPTMGSNCYSYMFDYCKSLTIAPELPATTLVGYCYYSMFRDCTSLTTAPALPATTLVYDCYYEMFYNCESLITAPALPATTLADSCYYEMFKSCESLTIPPALPATILAKHCYHSMFSSCTSLAIAPSLPATTLTESCYEGMFSYCSSLTTAPELSAMTLAEGCYYGMFKNCSSLTTAPELPATTLANNCYRDMFDYCTSLTAAPELPATRLAERCYESMFGSCTSLTTAPALPATKLADYCYMHMFSFCTKFTTPPALPATKLANYCYSCMFYKCTSLKLSTTKTGDCQYAYRIPMTGTGTTATDALKDMFYNTGGTFTGGTPDINTTYYTTNSPVK